LRRGRQVTWLLDNSRIRQLADWTSRGLVNSRTRQLAYWTSRGLDNSRMPAATACLVFVLLAASAKPRVDQSARCPVRELAYPGVVQLPVTQGGRRGGAYVRLYTVPVGLRQSYFGSDIHSATLCCCGQKVQRVLRLLNRKTYTTRKARFLLLQPCGHVVEVMHMDQWVENSTPSPPYSPQSVTCPICKNMVGLCPR